MKVPYASNLMNKPFTSRGLPRDKANSGHKFENTKWRQTYNDGRIFRNIAPVPRAMGEMIKQRVWSAYRDSEERERYFEVASKEVGHVIGGQYKDGRCEAPIGQELLKAMNGPHSSVGRKKLWEILAPLIERVDYHFGEPWESKWTICRLTQEAQTTVERATEFYLPATAAQFDRLPRRRPVKHQVPEFDAIRFEASAKDRGTIIRLTEHDLKMVQQLSAHPFFFDRVGALTDPTVRADKKLYRRVLKMPHGIVFAQYKLARSGRLVTFDLHVQGLKKCLRKYLRPVDCDRVFIYLDFKSQEPRLFAYVSGDRKLLRAVDDGDIYMTLVEAVGIKGSSGDTARDKAKRAFCTLIYGGSVRSIAIRLCRKDKPKKGEELSNQERNHYSPIAQRVVEWFKSNFPVAAQWMEDAAQRIKQDGQAVTLLDGVVRTEFDRDEAGEILDYRDYEKPDDEQLGGAKDAGVNHLLQGLGADIMRRLLVALDELLRRYAAKVALAICDAVLIECPRAWQADVAAIAKDSMEMLPMEWLPNAWECNDGQVLFPVEQAEWGVTQPKERDDEDVAL